MTEKLTITNELAVDAEYKIASLELLRKRIIDRSIDLFGSRSIKYKSSDQGMDPVTGFDCSGFVYHVIENAALEQQLDLAVPRHANEQWREFGEYISYRQRKAGDLVFFPSKIAAGIRVIGHVGIVLDSLSYIHAPGKDDTYVHVDELPDSPVELSNIQPNDIYTHSPAGVKRITLPIGDGRWHVQ